MVRSEEGMSIKTQFLPVAYWVQGSIISILLLYITNDIWYMLGYYAFIVALAFGYDRVEE